MEHYDTKSGYVLGIGRIHRRVIDAFMADNPPPEPPTKKVEVWGSEPNDPLYEELPVYDDPDYLNQLRAYHVDLAYKELALVMPAIKIIHDTGVDTTELRELGVIRSHVDFLRVVVLADDHDLVHVLEQVFFNSTVTARGIEQACKSYGVRWYGKDVLAYKPPTLPVIYSREFEDRMAAKWGHYTWSDFCGLSGQEQSAVVAHFLIENRLQWLKEHK